jgi:hypothetical protein
VPGVSEMAPWHFSGAPDPGDHLCLMSNRGGRYRRGALAHAGPERPADNADYRLGDGLGALSLQPFSVMTGFPGRSPAEALAPCQ